jgi:hypothetical protein
MSLPWTPYLSGDGISALNAMIATRKTLLNCNYPSAAPYIAVMDTDTTNFSTASTKTSSGKYCNAVL